MESSFSWNSPTGLAPSASPLRGHISWERFEFHLQRILAGVLLVSITAKAGQSPADHVIAFVLRLLGGAPPQCSVKSEPGPVNVLGSEAQMVRVELTRLEELVKELVLIVF